MKPRLLKLWGYAIVACLLAAVLIAVINPGVISALPFQLYMSGCLIFSMVFSLCWQKAKNPAGGIRMGTKILALLVIVSQVIWFLARYCF